MRRRVIAEASAAFALVATLALAPTARAHADEPPVTDGPSQSVPAPVATKVSLDRGGFEASSGEESLIAGGTNADWAKLVLMYGGWPRTDENVQVILRWMRQENGPPDWFNRNNPLNLGAGGFGTFPDLVTAAHSVANNLSSNSGYSAIRASLAKGTSAAATAEAIWWSPWSGSHYANGTHWSTAPVQIVKAPASAW